MFRQILLKIPTILCQVDDLTEAKVHQAIPQNPNDVLILFGNESEYHLNIVRDFLEDHWITNKEYLPFYICCLHKSSTMLFENLHKININDNSVQWRIWCNTVYIYVYVSVYEFIYLLRYRLCIIFCVLFDCICSSLQVGLLMCF